MAEANRRSFEVPSSADEAVAFLTERNDTQVRLLANRSLLADDHHNDCATTIVLDRLLFGVPISERRAVWRRSVVQIVGALHDLTSLTVDSIGLRADGLVEMARHCPDLDSLTLRSCGIRDVGTAAFAELLPGLTVLDLTGNYVGEKGAHAIASRLPHLRSLALAGGDIGITGAETIASRLHELTRLQLVGTNVGDGGALAIATWLEGLTELSLRSNQVGEAGVAAIATKAAKLTNLDLGDNDIGEPGTRLIARRLTGLTSLRLDRNRIGEGGARSIADHLLELSTLDVSSNMIGDDGARAIAEGLPRLTSLDLNENQIQEDGARSIAEQLIRLTHLGLVWNDIQDGGSTAIAAHLGDLVSLSLGSNLVGERGAMAIAEHLIHLTRLQLGSNLIGDAGARSIATRLSALTHLYLWAAGVTDDGAHVIATNLPELTVLDLSDNRVTDAGARFIAAHQLHLVSLSLGGNRVGDVSARSIAANLTDLTCFTWRDGRLGPVTTRAIAEHLPNITHLDFGGNQAGDVGARAVAAAFPNVRALDLEGNGISEAGIRTLLDALTSDPYPILGSLSLSDNPGVHHVNLPELAASPDARAFLATYRRLRETGDEDKVAFGEVKLVVLGNEAVGKTSLIRALVDGKRSDPDEARTAGVNHRIWVTPWVLTGDETAQLNIWDFGGQEITHQTHRYFLTERCIHLIVLDRRYQDDTSVYTWLQTVAARAPDSPVVIVVNKCDDGTHNLDIDFKDLRRRYPEIVAVLRATCAPAPDFMTVDESMAPLRACLERLVAEDRRLSSVHTRVPEAWVRVREDVRTRARESQVLGIDEFVNICHAGERPALRVTDPDDQRGLLRLLHQIGTVVAHGLTAETTTLTGLTLLDPNWFTGAVYALLDYGTAEFDRDDLGKRLRTDPGRAALYSDDRLDYIIDLLQQPEFALAFRLPGNVAPPRYLLPEALTPTAPTSIIGWDTRSLRFRLRYELLPRGLIPQFQVRSHEHAGPTPERWRSGCTLLIHGCPVLVDGKPADGIVDIQVAGPPGRRRDALAVVRSLFELVHERMPEAAPEERVPLPDDPAVDVSYEHLRRLEATYGPDRRFLPEGAQHEHTVGDLLTGVRNHLVREPPPPAPAAPVEPGAGVSRGADGAQVGGALGAVVGCTAAAFYLLGQGNGWPVETFLAGGGIGGITGAAIGLTAAQRRRRQPRR